jgi:hypothetical protein
MGADLLIAILSVGPDETLDTDDAVRSRESR